MVSYILWQAASLTPFEADSEDCAVSEIASEQWETILDRAGERVTIRIPRDLREQMDVRARTAGRTMNEEYGRAIEAWCGGGAGWFQQLLRAEAIHEWVSEDVVQGQQIGPILVHRLELDGKYIGLGLRGYAITLDRQWFVSDQVFELARAPLAAALPLLAESGAGWGSDRQSSTIFTYGRAGQPCRKIGCLAGASETVSLSHKDSRGKVVDLDVPLCNVHALETRATIAQGEAPRFRVA